MKNKNQLVPFNFCPVSERDKEFEKMFIALYGDDVESPIFSECSIFDDDGDEEIVKYFAQIDKLLKAKLNWKEFEQQVELINSKTPYSTVDY